MEHDKEPYPIDILPKSTYIERLGVENLLAKYQNLLAVRMVTGCVEDYFIETEEGEKQLSGKVFANSMVNLSLNLAGGLFDTDRHAHLRFLPSGDDATRPWKGESIPPALYLTDGNYTIYDVCFGLCFQVRDIHNRTFPFHKHFETQEERDEYERRAIVATSDEEKAYDAHLVGVFKGKKQSVKVNSRIKIHHAPTMLNYWHMTLDTYRPTDVNYILPTDRLKSADRTMFKSLKQDLMQHYEIDQKPDYCIKPCDYQL